MKKQVCTLTICLLQAVVFAEIRMWYCTDGTSFAGEYIVERLDRYYFRDQRGKTRSVSVKDIVPGDERYIRTMVPPEIGVDFSKKEYMPRGAYADKDARIVDGTLKIKKVGRKPFYGTLRGELYFVGEEVATDHYMLLARKEFTARFSGEEVPEVEIQLQAETRVYREYNGLQMRGRKYSGYAVVLFSPAEEIIEFKTDLKWLTRDKLEAFRQFREFNFFNEDCKKLKVPRPKYYTGRGYMP